MMDRYLQAGAIALLLVMASGCGGAYDSTVSGAVTLDGTAVPRGTVAFHPTASGPAAYAPIQEDGTYSIHTGREVGLPSGKYQVTVTANEAPAQIVSKTGGPMPPGKAITPMWYRSKESSGLSYDVQRGANEINLELSTQPPAGWNTGRRR